jgi:YggT family protein
MAPIFAIPYMVLNVIWFFIIAHLIMSWLIAFNVLNLYQPIVAQIWSGLNRLLHPIYSRIRQFLPNMGGLDLTPLIALLIVAAVAIYFGLLRPLTHRTCYALYHPSEGCFRIRCLSPRSGGDCAGGCRGAKCTGL